MVVPVKAKDNPAAIPRVVAALLFGQYRYCWHRPPDKKQVAERVASSDTAQMILDTYPPCVGWNLRLRR